MEKWNKKKKNKKQKTKNKQTNKKNLIAFKCYYPSLISGSKRSVHEGKEKTRKLNMHLSQSPWPMTKKKNFWSPSSRKNVITTDWKILIGKLKVLSCENSTAPQDFKWDHGVLVDPEDQRNRHKSNSVRFNSKIEICEKLLHHLPHWSQRQTA